MSLFFKNNHSLIHIELKILSDTSLVFYGNINSFKERTYIQTVFSYGCLSNERCQGIIYVCTDAELKYLLFQIVNKHRYLI